MEWSSFWDREHLAEYYRNEAIMNGDIAAVHLESAEDESFWDMVLQLHHPGKYYYVYSSKSKKGVETSGRSACLSFLGYLDKRFFVCIDSDTDSIRKGHLSRAEEFVLQTYTYSWESIVCHIPELQTRFKEINKSSKRSFNFTVFLKKYSKTVVKGLAMAIESEEKADDTVFNNLWSILKTQCKSAEMKNDGEVYAQVISEQLTEYSKLTGKEARIDKGLEILANRGITDDNAYMYVRGHNLYDLIVYIGKESFYNDGLSFERDILKDNYPLEGYEEVDMIQSDIAAIVET